LAPSQFLALMFLSFSDWNRISGDFIRDFLLKSWIRLDSACKVVFNLETFKFGSFCVHWPFWSN
jgi:hypothetical protein